MNQATQPGITRPTVLVTGASGYIAGWIIKYLLEEGYTVHATVRDPNKQSSVAHLLKMVENSPGALKLFKADLLDKGSFAAAMDGCQIVMHTASPFVLEGFTDAHEALVRPALEGTRNVLESVNACASVKRVVLTSSVAAVFGDNDEIGRTAGQVFTEEHWNKRWEKNWEILLAVLHTEDFPLLRNSQRGMGSADAGDMLLGRNEVANHVFRRETQKLLAQ